MDFIIFSICFFFVMTYFYMEATRNNHKVKQMNIVIQNLTNIKLNFNDIDDVITYIERELDKYDETNDLVIYTLILYCLRVQLSPRIICACDRYIDITEFDSRKNNLAENVEKYGY